MCSKLRSEKWRRKYSSRHTQKGLSVAHSPYNILYLYSMVGRSIASISDLGGIFTSVVYIDYGPPYRTIYIIHVVW